MIRKAASESFATRLRKRWVLVLFSLPFAGVGIGFLFWGVIPSIWESRQMQGWELGYAQLIDAGVRTHYSDDGETYQAYATYTYEFIGQHYRGERVGINTGSDNVGDFHQDVGGKLERALRNGEPVPVWVNPEDPSQAVLNRDLRWGMILFQLVFVLAFGGVGIGLLLFCLLKPESKRSEVELAGIDIASQPWLIQRDWEGPLIYSDATAGVWVVWAFAGFWNVIAIPSAVFAAPEVLAGNYAAALVFMFPLVGIGLLTWAIQNTLRWRRFGKTPVLMDPYPGAIGGQVGGTVDIPLAFQHDYMFKTALCCLYSYMSGSGDDRSRKERVVWQSDGYANAKPWNSGTRLEVLFDVEDKLPQSDSKDSSSYHLWRLNISCDLPGADFDRIYEIPVFPTGQSAKLLRQLSTDHHQAADHRLQEIEAVLNMEQIPGGIQINYPAFKKPLGKFMGIVFGIFFFGAGMIAGSQGAPIIFPIVFGGIGGLIAVGSFYSLVVGLKVLIDNQQLQTTKNIFGIAIGHKTVRRDDIQKLKIKKSYSQSSGSKHQTFFKIQAVTKDDKKIDIGFNLAGQNVANQALESICLLTGLPADSANAK
jgi:hypothetical protein